MTKSESNKARQFDSLPDVLSIDDLMLLLRIGRNTAYNLVKNKRIKTIRIGKKYIIPKQNVIDFLSNS